MAVDPIERVRQWTSVLFLAGLAVVVLPVGVWEMVVRHGVDYGVDGALSFAITTILAGGVVVRRSGKDGP